MKAHLFKDRQGQLYFSGHLACGDPQDGAGVSSRAKSREFDAIIDVGRSFILTSDEPPKLYLTGPGKGQFSEWTPGELYVAAKKGWFGFKLEEP